jgi:hypothetical protein
LGSNAFAGFWADEVIAGLGIQAFFTVLLWAQASANRFMNNMTVAIPVACWSITTP